MVFGENKSWICPRLETNNSFKCPRILNLCYAININLIGINLTENYYVSMQYPDWVRSSVAFDMGLHWLHYPIKWLWVYMGWMGPRKIKSRLWDKWKLLVCENPSNAKGPLCETLPYSKCFIVFLLPLTLCFLMDFPVHIDTIIIRLSIAYFKGSWVEFSKLGCISVPDLSEHCRPLWNAALCRISYGSSLFAIVLV